MIGWGGVPFQGSFDGNGHIISNFTYHNNERDLVGFFSMIGKHGLVQNLTLRNINITARNYVGGLAGHSNGTISNCQITGKVSGESAIGGLVGWNWLTNISEVNELELVDVAGNEYVGQVVGLNRLPSAGGR
jgi:hypothetical protein